MKRLDMKKRIYTMAIGMCFTATGAIARDIYVSTNGNDSNPGTIEQPYLTPHKAVEVAEPGDIIYLRGGTYVLTERIKIPQKETTAEKRIGFYGYPGEKVIIDGSGIVPKTASEFKMARCIYLNHLANYWHFRNLEICNAKDNGMKVEGNYNIIEQCIFHDNNDTGLQIGMYKDFSIEETKELPAGEPQFNPGYQFCRGNIVINCDSYYNYDRLSFNGSDDGGDADGFACKLFPGPGTEFIGCRAWNNSDDNWDLYMVYHPVRIEQCYAWNAGYDKDGNECGNGNGFKLGGGGSSGGAAFSQSVGAHVVTGCVAFNNLVKGFDQNNAYEAMYLINNVAWGNEYNYRFSTVLPYGTMYMRNCIGFNARKTNHEFLSADKEGSKLPNTEGNSWTMMDGCDPYKEGNKVNGTKVYTKDYTAQFKSLTETLAKAEREPDGSLPDNDFARLVEGSLFIDKGENFSDFIPKRFMTEDEANGLELIEAAPITIPYNDVATDMGAFETGVPTMATLKWISGETEQLVYRGSEITPITFRWGQAATGIIVNGLEDSGLTVEIDSIEHTITLSGKAEREIALTLNTIGGVNVVEAQVKINVSDTMPATLVCLTNNNVQTVDIGSPIADIIVEYGGGATHIELEGLPQGLTYSTEGKQLTISGTPETNGVFVIHAIGGMKELTLTGEITRVVPTIVLTGDWYNIQDEIDHLPSDLQGVVSLVKGSDDASNPTVWNPTYVESSGNPASGCTVGAVNMERNGGGIEWKLPSLAELKVNLHFTGKRKLKVTWLVNGEEEKSWTSESYAKQTMTKWDLMKNAGIEPTTSPITVRLTNQEGSGGIRLYDFFVRIYKEGVPEAIHPSSSTPSGSFSIYRTQTTIIVQGNQEISNLTLYNLAGQPVSRSHASQVIRTDNLQQGIYLLQVVTRKGEKEVFRISLK